MDFQRSAIFVPVSAKLIADEMAIDLQLVPSSAHPSQLSTFSVSLVSISGANTADPLYYGMCGRLQESTQAQFEKIEGVKFYHWWDSGSNKNNLRKSWNNLHEGEYWDWFKSLQELELKRGGMDFK